MCIRSILIIFYLFLANSGRIQNKSQICSLVKSELYSIAKYYQTLDYNLKTELFEQSLRPFAYEILENAQFEQNISESIQRLKTGIEEGMKSIDFKLYKANKFIQELQAQEIQNNVTFSSNIDNFSQNEEWLIQAIKRGMNELNGLQTQLKANPQLGAAMNLSVFLSVIETKINKDMGMNLADDSTFALCSNVLRMGKVDPSVVTLMQDAKREYEAINGYIADYDTLIANYNMEMNAPESQAYNELKIAKNEAWKNYGLEKAKVLAAVSQLKNATIASLRKIDLYQAYSQKIVQTKQFVQQKLSVESEIKSNQESLINSHRRLKILTTKRGRLIPEDIMMLLENIESLEEILTFLKAEFSAKYLSDSAAIEKMRQMKDQYSTAHLERLKLLYRIHVSLKEKIEFILASDARLDELLGRVFADLQSNDRSSDFEVCMSDQEFSIFAYFMSITGIISSNTSFLKAFLGGLHADIKIKSARQIYRLFLNRNFVEKHLISINDSVLDDEQEAKVVSDFDDLMKAEMVYLFKDQLDEKRNPSLLKMVMNQLGIENYDILDKIINVGYCTYFPQLSAAILGVIGLTMNVGLVTATFTVFLCWLSTKIIKKLYAIYTDPEELAKAKSAYNRSMMKVYRALFSENVYSLNYVEYLSSNVTQSEVSLKDFMRFPKGGLNQKAFMILDSIYSGNDMLASMHNMGRRLRAVI